MPYRLAPPVRPTDDGREHAAIVELASVAARLRRGMLALGVLLGLASTVAGYLVARELQFMFFGVAFPWLSALVGGVPFFASWIRVARRVGDALVRWRAPRWIEDRAVRYRVPTATLTAYAELL